VQKPSTNHCRRRWRGSESRPGRSKWISKQGRRNGETERGAIFGHERHADRVNEPPCLSLLRGTLACCRRRQKENQDDLLQRVNEATLQMLNKGVNSGSGATGSGRKITSIVAYRSAGEMQSNNTLTMQVGPPCCAQTMLKHYQLVVLHFLPSCRLLTLSHIPFFLPTA
jgi:hypothetical protein